MRDEFLKSVIKKYSRYVVHMRQQFYSQPMHFGLVLGAGASVGLGFPDWNQLVKCISDTDEMKILNYVIDTDKDAMANAERLYQVYHAKRLLNCSEGDKKYNRIEMKIRASWQEIVHSALYQKIPESIKDLVPKSHYLWAFIELIKELPMTVNYNFDDSIQQMLAATRSKVEKDTNRGYTTIWNSNVYMYPKNSVIYHPNGFLPHNMSDHPSEQLVFLEDSFADQLIESINGRYSVLSNYFTHNTCLLIGLSLNDPTLRHILRNNSLNFPGSYHYLVNYVKEGTVIENQDAIINANFDVYNLITLFLHDDEIRALGELITMREDEFQGIVEELGLHNSYKFIIVGSVAVGKTTALSNFRSISTQDEWLEPMPKEMAKDPGKVDEDNINLIDKWVAEQWGKKNYKLLRLRDGIHLIDRGPLDAFAFTPKGQWVQKAELTKKGISPGQSDRQLCPANVIYLIGDPETMAARALASHRQTDSKKLDLQQNLLGYIYGRCSTGVKILDTRNKGKSQVAKEIARIIYLDDYVEAPLQSILEGIATGIISEPAEV